jgi:hypothetical protein
MTIEKETSPFDAILDTALNEWQNATGDQQIEEKGREFYQLVGDYWYSGFAFNLEVVESIEGNGQTYTKRFYMPSKNEERSINSISFGIGVNGNLVVCSGDKRVHKCSRTDIISLTTRFVPKVDYFGKRIH